MAERAARVGAPGASRWAALAIPMAAVIRTVLRSLDLPEATERRGLEVATDELRKLSAEYDG